MRPSMTFFSYREAAPSAEFSHLIWSFWEFRVAEDAPGPLRHEVFPDGCISIFYLTNKKYNFSLLGCSSLPSETVVTEVVPGNIYWAFRVAPAACASVFGTAPEKLPRGPGFEYAPLTAGLTDELDKCDSFEQAIAVFERRFANLSLAPDDLDDNVVKAVQMIEESKGMAKITDIANSIGISMRHLQRNFRKHTGLTPKQFTRTRRFRATAISMLNDIELNWAQRAAEFGFTDQSHLSNEFSAVSGRSPNSFAEKVSKIDHGDLL